MGGEQSDVLITHQASAGQVGGEELHQLTEEEMPNHTHGIQYFRRDAGSGSGDPWNGTGGGPASMGSSAWRNNGNVRAAGSGGDQPHNNMQPYMALNYMMKVRGLDNPLEEIQNQLNLNQLMLDSLLSPTTSEFFVLNGSRQLSYCNCVHCDESSDQFSEWGFYSQSELIAMDISATFDTHLHSSGINSPGSYWSNSITIELESEVGDTYPCQYQDDEFARIVVPFSGIFRIHVTGNLTAHFPNGGCMQAEQNWRVLKSIELKHFFTLLLAAACLTAVGQVDIEYPYNPDFENGCSVRCIKDAE